MFYLYHWSLNDRILRHSSLVDCIIDHFFLSFLFVLVTYPEFTDFYCFAVGVASIGQGLLWAELSRIAQGSVRHNNMCELLTLDQISYMSYRLLKVSRQSYWQLIMALSQQSECREELMSSAMPKFEVSIDFHLLLVV